MGVKKISLHRQCTCLETLHIVFSRMVCVGGLCSAGQLPDGYSVVMGMTYHCVHCSGPKGAGNFSG